jgi:hypothetical protein
MEWIAPALTLLAKLFEIGVDLAAGRITPEEARAKRDKAMDEFAAEMRMAETGDAARLKKTLGELDKIDEAKRATATVDGPPPIPMTGLIGDDGSDAE